MGRNLMVNTLDRHYSPKKHHHNLATNFTVNDSDIYDRLVSIDNETANQLAH